MELLAITSVEFYTIAFIVAAAVVAMCVKPPVHGEVITEFVRGTPTDGIESEPSLQISVDNENRVTVFRLGFEDLTAESVVTLVVNKKGFDLEIKERVSISPGEYVNSAVFMLNFLAPERYHVTYQADNSERFVAFNLTVKPGNRFEKQLVS